MHIKSPFIHPTRPSTHRLTKPSHPIRIPTAIKPFYLRTNPLQTTNTRINLRPIRIHAPQLHRLSTRQLIQRRLRNIKPLDRVVDRQDVDANAVVRQRVAGAAIRIVPAGDGGRAADEREGGQAGLRAVALGNQAVSAVAAGDGREGAGTVVVACVVGDGDCGGGGEEGEDGGEDWELHFELDGDF